jgi:Bacterial regulatory proteins, tetR family
MVLSVKRDVEAGASADAVSRVLDAAEELFYARGIQAVGMDDVRDRSGVARLAECLTADIGHSSRFGCLPFSSCKRCCTLYQRIRTSARMCDAGAVTPATHTT